MMKLDLNGAWVLVGTAPDGTELSLEGQVPGSALNDVLRAGIEALPGGVFWRDNTDRIQKYEDYDWVYRKSFTLDQIPSRPVLTFERLDTYCDIFLNDRHLTTCQNGNIGYEFDVENRLILGENTLEIRFYSPVARVRGQKPYSGAFTKERMHTRRTQCTYGWDWTARFVTCGISGDAALVERDTEMTVLDGYIHTESACADYAILRAEVELENFTAGGVLDFEILDPAGQSVALERQFCDTRFVTLYYTLPRPERWYPLGYGGQPLYRFRVLRAGVPVWEQVFGIRRVEILELPDAPGSANYEKCQELKTSKFAQEYDHNQVPKGFILQINGVKILCKGANWVPCEPFCTGNSDKKVTEALEMAAKAGVNMIRIWGGGRFETTHFYDECSRLGLLVTQDFLMACGEYPEKEEWFLEELKKEAAYIARLIRNQPCLVWWTGDNENAIYAMPTDSDHRGRDSACKAIGPVLRELDPHRRFLPSSPYGGARYGSNTVGTTHNTQFMGNLFSYFQQENTGDFREFFKQFRARFVAEEPTMGAVSLETLQEIMTEADIFGDSDAMWLYHTKTNPYLSKELFHYTVDIARGMLGDWKDPVERLFKYQYVQYEWVRLSLEQTRREKWFSAGMIFWMLNDCWPAASGWALTDFYNRPKASWYAFRNFAKPVITAFDRVDGKYRLYACNDGGETAAEIRVLALGKGIREVCTWKGVLPANETIPVADVDMEPGEFLVARSTTAEGGVHTGFYHPGVLALKPTEDFTWKQSGELLEITAGGYLHAVVVEGCDPEDSYFPLLPGETRTLSVENGKKITVKAYTV